MIDAATGTPLPGANVLLQELRRGAATDVDGRFEITDVPAGSYTLVATFISYREYTAPVTVVSGQPSVVTISMEEDRLGLEEVVVTGQGAAIETRRLSTTVEVITPRQIEATPATRLDELLQANLPGAQVRFSSGQPGTASLIRSRGPISAFSSTTPVIYVDGVRVDNLNTSAALGIDTGGAQSSALPDIPIENIERIEFIKGGAATTLYGSDAANGVIQIFTKRGLPGQSSVAYETLLGSMVGTEDFLKYNQTADLLYRPGFVQQHRLSGNGGGGGLTYSFAGSLYGDDGFREGNRQQQYGLRTTVGARVTEALQYTGSFGFTGLGFSRDLNANNGLAVFGGLEGGFEGDLSTLSAEELSAIGDSIRSLIDLYSYEGDTRRFQTSQQLDLTPRSGLTFKGIIGLDYRANTEQEIQGPAFLTAAGQPPTSSTLIRSQRRFLGLTLEATGQHQADVGDFSFISTAGGTGLPRRGPPGRAHGHEHRRGDDLGQQRRGPDGGRFRTPRGQLRGLRPGEHRLQGPLLHRGRVPRRRQLGVRRGDRARGVSQDRGGLRGLVRAVLGAELGAPGHRPEPEAAGEPRLRGQIPDAVRERPSGGGVAVPRRDRVHLRAVRQPRPPAGARADVRGRGRPRAERRPRSR